MRGRWLQAALVRQGYLKLRCKAHRMNGTAPSPARTAKLPHVSTRTHVLRASNVCKAASSQGRSTHGGTVAVSFAWLQDVFALAICTYVRRTTLRWNPSNPRTYPSTAYECARSRMQDHRVAGGRTKRTRSSRKVASEARCQCLTSLSEPGRKLAFEACSWRLWRPLPKRVNTMACRSHGASEALVPLPNVAFWAR